MYKFDKRRFRQPRNVPARAKSQNHHASSAFSTVAAIAALIVALVSAGAAVWQTRLVHDQLTASDRNRSFQELVQQAGNICELFFPNKIKAYSYAAQADGTSIIAVAREDIDPSIFRSDLAEIIAAESRKLRLAFTVAGLWSTSDQATRFSKAEHKVMELFQYFSSPDLSAPYYRDFFAMRYVKASHACTNDRGTTLSASISGLVNNEEDWWLDSYDMPEQIIVAPQAKLERLDRAQIRQLAKQQAELLKNYDSYNQL